MKKILSLLLCGLMLVSMLALVGCGNDNKPADKDDEGTSTTKPADKDEATTVKFGAAVYVGAASATDATADKAGQGSVDVTAAAVTVDADGKIVACDLDIMQNKVSYDATGKAIANAEFKTKRELGAGYNMVTYGGAAKEWFEQADAFEALIKGKTVAEIKALMIDGNKGNDEVVNAGCTIKIDEFVNAIEKAVANAKTEVAADATVKAVLSTSQSCTDATVDKAGTNQIEVYTFGAALKDGKVIVGSSDCVQVKFTFDAAGVSTFDATKAIASKREQGANYGMVAYGGAAKEWFEQADAFDALCAGKTGAEIGALLVTSGENAGKGNEDVINAGCTIYVSGLVAAASKI